MNRSKLYHGTVEAVGKGVYTTGIYTDGGRVVINGGTLIARGNNCGMRCTDGVVTVTGGTVIVEGYLRLQ